MQDNRLGVSLPERLVEKSHFLSRLFERPLILNPVLQRNTRKINHWCHSTQNSGRHFFFCIFLIKKRRTEGYKTEGLQWERGQTSAGSPESRIDWNLQSQLQTESKQGSLWTWWRECSPSFQFQFISDKQLPPLLTAKWVAASGCHNNVEYSWHKSRLRLLRCRFYSDTLLPQSQSDGKASLFPLTKSAWQLLSGDRDSQEQVGLVISTRLWQ